VERLRNGDFHDLYLSNVIRVIISGIMRRAGNVTLMGERRFACRVLAGKPEGKRPLGRPRCRWKVTLVIHFQEVGWGHGLSLSGSG
jgi:hypothetical protein